MSKSILYPEGIHVKNGHLWISTQNKNLRVVDTCFEVVRAATAQSFPCRLRASYEPVLFDSYNAVLGTGGVEAAVNPTAENLGKRELIDTDDKNGEEL